MLLSKGLRKRGRGSVTSVSPFCEGDILLLASAYSQNLHVDSTVAFPHLLRK